MANHYTASGDPALRLYPFGEAAIVLEFRDNTGNHSEKNAGTILVQQKKLLRLTQQLERTQSTSNHRDQRIRALKEIVPGDRNLTLCFDPAIADGNEIIALLDEHWPNCADATTIETGSDSLVRIPVIYGGEAGPDLEAVADHHQLDPAAVIELHSNAIYTVLFNGFLPGFGYLHGLPPQLHTARRATPRTRVEAGSIAIGGANTGIYPSASPGGWQIIGRCADPGLVFFDHNRNPPQLLGPGCRIKFEVVNRQPC